MPLDSCLTGLSSALTGCRMTRRCELLFAGFENRKHAFKCKVSNRSRFRAAPHSCTPQSNRKPFILFRLNQARDMVVHEVRGCRLPGQKGAVCRCKVTGMTCFSSEQQDRLQGERGNERTISMSILQSAMRLYSLSSYSPHPKRWAESDFRCPGQRTC